MPRRLRIGFTGYYGMSNFGDDLFGAVCATAARRFWHGEPRLAGPAIADAESRHTMPRWYPAAAYGASGALGKVSRLYSFLRAVQGSDVLVMGGGSVITARESFRKPLMLSAQRRGKLQLAAVGVSIGPFDDTASEASVAAFIERFAYISVRDRRSYELALRMGLGGITHHGRDLAGLMPSMAPQRSVAEDRPIRIGLAPCNYTVGRGYPVPDPRAVQASMVESLTQLAARRRLQVDVFSLNGHVLHGDEALAQDLQQGLRERGIATGIVRYAGQGPFAVARAIAHCDAFVSVRLHGAIVAYLQGVPFTIVDYHPKCADFADDVGLPAAQRITAQRQGADAFSEALASMLDGNGEPALSREIYARQAQDIFKCGPWATAEAAA